MHHVTLLRLPSDLLRHIAVHLGGFHAQVVLLMLEQTCKTLFKIAHDDGLWQRLCFFCYRHSKLSILKPIYPRDWAESWKHFYFRRLHSYRPEVAGMWQRGGFSAVERCIMLNRIFNAASALVCENGHDEHLKAVLHRVVSLYDVFMSSKTSPMLTLKHRRDAVGACLLVAYQQVSGAAKVTVADCVQLAQTAPKMWTPVTLMNVVSENAVIFGCIPGHDVHAHIQRILRAFGRHDTGSKTFRLTHLLGLLSAQSEIALQYSAQVVAICCFKIALFYLGFERSTSKIVVAYVYPRESVRCYHDIASCMDQINLLARSLCYMFPITELLKKRHSPSFLMSAHKSDIALLRDLLQKRDDEEQRYAEMERWKWKTGGVSGV
jgi:hypothetical protein